MGAGQSKQTLELKSAANYYDAIAVHYILTQNFKDLKALTTKAGCDKLVILTKKVLKKFLTTSEITYLAQRVENGIPKNALKKEELTFIRPVTKRESPKRTITSYTYKDEDGGMGTYQSESKNISVKSKGKHKMMSMDVKNKENKDRMCKGIAKFYVKIAHLYAAMMKSVNPLYKYTDSAGKEHEVSLLNRNKIPKGVDVTLSEVNLCNRRINALTTPQSGEGKITVGTNCSINKKTRKNKFSSDSFSDPTEWGSSTVLARTLGEEPGVQSLLDLYKDEYKYLTGEWVIGIKGAKKLQKDTKTFYKAFTGKTDRDYKQWNPTKSDPRQMKNFTTIPLVDYHNQPECQKEGEGWRRKYIGDSTEPLFAKYAENLKTMLKNANDRQNKLLKKLDIVFDWFDKDEPQTGGGIGDNANIKNKYLGLHKDLTEQKLDKIVNEVRDILVEIYLGCEREYKTGLQLFEAIVTSRTLERDAKRKKELESKRERSLGSDQDDPKIKELIDKEITQTVKENITQPAVESMESSESKEKKGKFLGVF
jgi:hypothetical protein|uniref:Uncharacterized protein n=1 Tax=viral metagenome TaxID=1070528 RepID=A0A6C0C053_9ZZZZ